MIRFVLSVISVNLYNDQTRCFVDRMGKYFSSLLIVRPGLLQSGQAVTVDFGGQSLAKIVGAQLEANDGLSFFALHNPPPVG